LRGGEFRVSAGESGDGPASEQEAREHQDFTTMILDNLRKAGIQNTRKEERLKFDRLDPFAGTWLHATGDYADTPCLRHK
jgi:adenine-specific DNA-methyltransferase